MSKATFDPTRYSGTQNPDFQSVLQEYVKRRSFIRGGAAMTGIAMMANLGLTACGGDSKKPAPPPSLGFDSIAGSKTDAVVVPNGYKAQLLAPWGTPLNDNAAAWKADGTNTAMDQANAVGQNHDGMSYYPLNGSNEDGLLCINHEYINEAALHPEGNTDERGRVLRPRTLAEHVRKEIYAHGVSVIRVRKTNGVWEVVHNDPHNRRFTGATEIEISGPMAGSSLLVTKFSPDGTTTRGTLNNCGSGPTPWGTYVTCEENWPDYFVNKDAAGLTAAQARIGVPSAASRYGWDEVAGDASEQNDEFTRFNLTPTAASAALDYRNEANGYGYIVEIDPYNPDAMAVKRTALGRFRHEGCNYGKLTAGEPVVFYSGHDARFEFVYKFVSSAVWDPADANRTDRLAVGAKYMDEGILYVAKFAADGVGMWLPLTPETATAATDTLPASTLGAEFGGMEGIIINTAGAAERLGATPMDRPEWGATDHTTGAIYMTMTNNSRRDATAGTNPANPRLNNIYGHVIRWEEGDAPTAFTWEIFVFGAPHDGDTDLNLSGLTEMNQFASPDGLVIDERGIMWIQTDNGNNAVGEETNDQMLAIVPSTLSPGAGDKALVDSANQAELRRFFVGPNGCEVTGLAYTSNYHSFFANIQHPRNWPYSVDDAAEATPAGTTVRPRSATVVIEKVDGGEVGV